MMKQWKGSRFSTTRSTRRYANESARSIERSSHEDESCAIAVDGFIGVAARVRTRVGRRAWREGTRGARPGTEGSQGIPEAGLGRERVQGETDLREVRGGRREASPVRLHGEERRVL